MSDQIQAVDKQRLVNLMGELNEEDMRLVSAAVKLHLALDD